MALFDNLFYHPTNKQYDSPEEYGLRYESVHFASQNEARLHAWWFPAAHDPQGTVVHCHGNAGNISGHFSHVCWLAHQGFNVLCFDYRGFGRSEGSPTRQGTIQDAHAAVDYIKGRNDADPRAILILGQSLGGAVAIVVAAERRDLAGVAVDGPLSSYSQEVEWVLKRQWYTYGVAKLVARWGISKGYEPIDYVNRISPTPLYLFHGKEDRICPWEMSQDLYDKAREPKGLWLIPGAGHYEALNELAEQARPRLVQFFESCIQAELIKNANSPALDA